MRGPLGAVVGPRRPPPSVEHFLQGRRLGHIFWRSVSTKLLRPRCALTARAGLGTTRRPQACYVSGCRVWGLRRCHHRRPSGGFFFEGDLLRDRHQPKVTIRKNRSFLPEGNHRCGRSSASWTRSGVKWARSSGLARSRPFSEELREICDARFPSSWPSAASAGPDAEAHPSARVAEQHRVSDFRPNGSDPIPCGSATHWLCFRSVVRSSW